MIPQAYITAWRAFVPWSDDAQIEQDLVLSRAVVELFSDPELSSSLAMRGGTALNKLLLERPARYSEDIDLVQQHSAPIGNTIDAIRKRLDKWLGKPKRSSGDASVTLTYRFDSEILPTRPLRLKIEINTREHFTVYGYQNLGLEVANPWFNGQAKVTTYELAELMGTKMRALYQRRKGRDLFDLWLCLTQHPIDPNQIVSCFTEYMKHEDHIVTRAQYEENLHRKEANADFLNDIRPLLTVDIDYDPVEALNLIRQELIVHLPGDPWRGPHPVD